MALMYTYHCACSVGLGDEEDFVVAELVSPADAGRAHQFSETLALMMCRHTHLHSVRQRQLQFHSEGASSTRGRHN